MERFQNDVASVFDSESKPTDRLSDRLYSSFQLPPTGDWYLVAGRGSGKPRRLRGPQYELIWVDERGEMDFRAITEKPAMMSIDDREE
jgi:phage terminase large subunit-like protein